MVYPIKQLAEDQFWLIWIFYHLADGKKDIEKFKEWEKVAMDGLR